MKLESIPTSAAFVLLAALLVLQSGCGYRVAGRTGAGVGGAMPGAVASVAVPVFLNETREPGIEGTATDAFASELATTVAVPSSNAEALLIGVIKEYEPSAVSFASSDVAQAYRLTVTVSLKLVKGSTVLWSVSDLTDYEDFTVDLNDVLKTRDNETQAFRTIVKDMARTAKERMLTGP